MYKRIEKAVAKNPKLKPQQKASIIVKARKVRDTVFIPIPISIGKPQKPTSTEVVVLQTIESIVSNPTLTPREIEYRVSTVVENALLDNQKQLPHSPTLPYTPQTEEDEFEYPWDVKWEDFTPEQQEQYERFFFEVELGILGGRGIYGAGDFKKWLAKERYNIPNIKKQIKN